MQTEQVFRFDSYRFGPGSGQLSWGTLGVSLAPKALRKKESAFSSQDEGKNAEQAEDRRPEGQVLAVRIREHMSGLNQEAIFSTSKTERSFRVFYSTSRE